jgi:Predicted membrane protein (DUF2157)
VSTPLEHLRRWQEAGLVDERTAQQISDFESKQRAAEPGLERPTFTEALIYLGVVVISVGVIVLASTNWGHLASWARIAVPGIPAAAALAAGWVMRGQAHAGVQRGGSAAWAAAAGLVAGTAAVTLNESGVSPENNVLASGLIMALVSFALWWPDKRHLQVVAGAIAGLVLSASASAETSRVSERWAASAGGLAMLGFGILATAAVELGLIRPRSICRLLGGLFIAIGGFWASAGTPFGGLEVLPFIAGAALVWASVRLAFFPYTVLGIAAIFAGTMVSILRHVSDPTVAAVALMTAGAVLITAVVMLARLRERRTGGGALEGGSARPA